MKNLLDSPTRAIIIIFIIIKVENWRKIEPATRFYVVKHDVNQSMTIDAISPIDISEKKRESEEQPHSHIRAHRSVFPSYREKNPFLLISVHYF